MIMMMLWIQDLKKQFKKMLDIRHVSADSQVSQTDDIDNKSDEIEELSVTQTQSGLPNDDSFASTEDDSDEFHQTISFDTSNFKYEQTDTMPEDSRVASKAIKTLGLTTNELPIHTTEQLFNDGLTILQRKIIGKGYLIGDKEYYFSTNLLMYSHKTMEKSENESISNTITSNIPSVYDSSINGYGSGGSGKSSNFLYSSTNNEYMSKYDISATSNMSSISGGGNSSNNTSSYVLHSPMTQHERETRDAWYLKHQEYKIDTKQHVGNWKLMNNSERIFFY